MDGETIPEECYDLPAFDPDEIDALLPPSPKRPCLSPATPRMPVQSLYTLKVTYDSRWTHEDYVKITDMLFPDSPKLLVVAEKMSTNAHVHMHGYSCYSLETFKKKCQKLKAMHYTMCPENTGYNPKSRPVSGASMVATETGFQYLCKEAPNPRNPLLQRGFSDAELLELHAKSQEFVKKLKFNTRDEIASIPDQYLKGNPKALFEKVMLNIGKKLREENKDRTRYTRQDVINGLLHHPAATDELIQYLMMLN